MADLSDVNSAQSVKLISASSTGAESLPYGFTNYKDQSRMWTEANYTEELNTAFGRLRVANPKTLFDTSFRFDKQPLLFNESTTNGTVTHDANTSSVILATTSTANGSQAIFQSNRRIPYQPGKGQLVLISGNMVSGVSNCRKHIGQYDANNGYYFEQLGSTFSIGTRTKVSGSVVDNTVDQANWNIDKLDGTGRSGITLDSTKQQIFLIDYQWLGSGRIRFGFVIGGKIIYCHEVINSNSITTPYGQTALLPIRISIANVGIAASTSTMKVTCVTVVSEGDYLQEGIVRSAGDLTTSKAISTTLNPLFAIRKQSTYIESLVHLSALNVYLPSDDAVVFRILYNPTITGGAWSTVPGYCEINTTGTAVSGGTNIYEFVLESAGGRNSSNLAEILEDTANAYLGETIAGVSDIICVAVQSLSGGASASAAMAYREIT